MEILVPMAGLIDPAAELARLSGQQNKAQIDLKKMESSEQYRIHQERAGGVSSRTSSGFPSCVRKVRSIGGPDRKGDRAQKPMNAARTRSHGACQINRVILGKEEQIRLCLACLLGADLLIEDIPGVGKTTLAHAIAKTLGCSFSACNSPATSSADGSGCRSMTTEPVNSDFSAVRFSRSWCCRRINRASPKAQSAVLEAMEEHQVTSTASRWRCRNLSS